MVRQMIKNHMKKAYPMSTIHPLYNQLRQGCGLAAKKRRRGSRCEHESEAMSEEENEEVKM